MPLSPADLARRLLVDCDCPLPVPDGGGDHPALAWRRAGLMAVTGREDGPALMCPAAFTLSADAALLALAALAPPDAPLPPHGALLLGERARLMGLQRGGAMSANRSCRLIAAADGHFALNLAREEDRDLLPAWLEADADGWDGVAREARLRPAADLVARGIEMGLPIALAAAPAPAPAPWLRRRGAGPIRAAGGNRPFVVDLAPLWAGPLAGSLLAMLGADVVKVESLARPDGARLGHAGFFDLLNGGKRGVALDFRSGEGRAALRRLVARADIVIEGSRPRALAQLGVDADEAVANGAIWVSITAYGREGAAADRVGFGDDAAVAAGLAQAMAAGWGEPMFAGDAIADPLTGLHAALAAWAAWCRGEAGLIALSLAETTAHAMRAGIAQGDLLAEWQAMAERDGAPLYPPRAPFAPARALGADTAAVLASC